MSEEQVDIVNEQDEVIGLVTKTEAHQKGLLHRTVIGELIDKKGNWILVRQSDHKQDNGQFVSACGGHVEAGESEEDALKREILEELGISKFAFKLIGKAVYNREVKGKKENHLFIVYTVFSKELIILNDESVEFKKFPPEELSQALRKSPDDFGPPLRFIIKKFFPVLLSPRDST